ncbi:unnamed protein product [Rotaria sordida]|uniref:Uncharacterized protein n=1 Tax=Rotaria sordida TaxID=392033 RepID=A0A814L4X1_9BILA|nr:unnamed protein product [Rotaria sordida]CAF1230270.1 unnamed protein product [Rotaria sordida]
MPLSTLSPRRPAKQSRATSATPLRTTQQEIEITDLVTPVKSTVIITQANYTIRTLTLYNQQRRSILPTFPTLIYNHDPDLLLAKDH